MSKQRKRYNTMQEINNELEILRMQRKIHELKVKQNTKDLKESLSFMNVVTTLIQKYVFKQ